MKVALPEYVAVIGCVPTARLVPVLLVAPVMVKVATPEVFTATVPLETVPSLNSTVPVGTAVPVEGRTVAVNTTVRPAAFPVLRAGFSEEVRLVVVATFIGGAATTMLMGVETLPAKAVEPANTAVRVWLPVASEPAGTVNVASPVGAIVATPRVVAPSLKLTEPAGTGVLTATTAVNIKL